MDSHSLPYNQQTAVPASAEFLSILQTLVVGVTQINMRGEIVFANEAACHILGLSFDNIVGRFYNDRDWRPVGLDGSSVEISELPVSRVFLFGETIANYEQGLLLDDGSMRYLNISAAPLLSDQGEMIGAVTSFQDITKRVELERELQTSRINLQALLASFTDLAIQMDEKGYCVNILTQNNDLLNEEQFVFQRHLQQNLTHPEFHQSFMNTIQRALLDGTATLEYKGNGILADRYYLARMANMNVTLHGRRQVSIHIQDITSQKEAENALVLAKNQAEAANQAKNAFLANMSHQIRTPMNAIQGFGELLKTHVNDPKGRERLENLLNSSERLMDQLNDVLDFSRMESGVLELFPEAVDLRQLLSRCIPGFRTLALERGLQFNAYISSELPKFLWIDGQKFRKIITHLIENALKFTNKGEVLLEIEEYQSEECKYANNLVIRVTDTGIGIPIGERTRIFESFRQSDPYNIRRFEGAGLGLAITRHLVELMNGHISVESQAGKGAVFSVVLNGIFGADTIVELQGKEESSLDPGEIRFKNRPKILIAEDLLLNRLVVSEFLEPYSIELIEACNGEEALQLAKAHKPDLIIMDFQMPVADGFSSMQAIRDYPELKGIPILAYTASGDRVNDALVSGLCVGYLDKPLNRKALIQTLSRFLPYDIV